MELPETPEIPEDEELPEIPEEDVKPEKPEKHHGRIHGNIHSSKQHCSILTLELWLEGSATPVYTITVENGNYTFDGVEPGTYLLKISGRKHVSRTLIITITEDSLELAQDIQLNLQGDLTGDGNVNVGDVAKVYAHVKGTVPLTDEYTRSCAKVTDSEEITIGDAAKIYAHVRGSKTLW